MSLKKSTSDAGTEKRPQREHYCMSTLETLIKYSVGGAIVQVVCRIFTHNAWKCIKKTPTFCGLEGERGLWCLSVERIGTVCT